VEVRNQDNSIGATSNRRLMYARGYALGEEFRVKGVNVALAPVAGPLGRAPAAGRNWEGFGADPYLAGTSVPFGDLCKVLELRKASEDFGMLVLSQPLSTISPTNRSIPKCYSDNAGTFSPCHQPRLIRNILADHGKSFRESRQPDPSRVIPMAFCGSCECGFRFPPNLLNLGVGAVMCSYNRVRDLITS